MAPQPPKKKYASTITHIYHAATVANLPLTDAEIEAKIWDFYEDVCRHISVSRRELNTDGKTWLAELLAWEHFFPNNKDSFPGIRPTFKNRPKKVEENGLPFCECCACLMWAQGDVRCPFIRIGKCGKGIHEDFKFRIGSEVNRKQVCAGCEEDRLREEGWVDVQMEREMASVVDEDEDEGWVMVDE